MAYVLGYFAADGSMIENGRGAHFIEFTTTDRILVENVRRAVNSNHKISKRPTRNKKWKQQYRLQIGSKDWFTDLFRLDFSQNKSNTLAFPKIPAPFTLDFIRGYFDGDGCVYFKKHFAKDRNKKRWVFTTRFTSGSKKFLSSLLTVLRLGGIRGGFILRKFKTSGYDLVLSRRDSIALYKLMYHTDPTAKLFLPRKRTLFRKALTTLYGSSFLDTLQS